MILHVCTAARNVFGFIHHRKGKVMENWRRRKHINIADHANIDHTPDKLLLSMRPASWRITRTANTAWLAWAWRVLSQFQDVSKRHQVHKRAGGLCTILFTKSDRSTTHCGRVVADGRSQPLVQIITQERDAFYSIFDAFNGCFQISYYTNNVTLTVQYRQLFGKRLLVRKSNLKVHRTLL